MQVPILYYYAEQQFEIDGSINTYLQPMPFYPTMYVYRIRWVNRMTGSEGIGEYIHTYEEARGISTNLSYQYPDYQYILQVEACSEAHPHVQYMRHLQQQEYARVLSVTITPLSQKQKNLERIAEVDESTDN
jgi:hypothetical protein